MLTITPTAAEALDTIVASVPDAPESAGLRIAAGAGPDGRPGLTLELAAAPAPTDQVVQGHDTPVFVEAQLAGELDDKVLDAEVDGDRVGFLIGQA
ncbi:MAG TPA: HesB/YadR/YfhF-family protein [Capillimicrobium sp.]|nr:HesB/YadR/YfhF-family protein [Capillimicrobium sp.]